MDGDTTETSETTDPTQPPEATDTERPEPQAERVSVEQLCDYVARASFATTLGRRGYQQSEVDALLVKVAETLRDGRAARGPGPAHAAHHVRLEDGYDPTQVDDFLAAVVDLDPNADAREARGRARAG